MLRNTNFMTKITIQICIFFSDYSRHLECLEIPKYRNKLLNNSGVQKNAQWLISAYNITLTVFQSERGNENYF